MKINVQLVTWNGMKYLPAFFDSLENQSFKDWEFSIFDNGSTDGTPEFLSNKLKEIKNKNQIFFRNENIGFSGGHNSLFYRSDSAYVMVLNQDLIFGENFFEKIVEYLDDHSEVAGAAPRLMRMVNGQKTDTVDSLGLKIDRSRKISDMGSGEEWKKYESEFIKPIPVFGITAAAACYRRSALGAELFDKDFFSYQEDVDLSWRLQLAGFVQVVLPDVVVYHERGVKEAGLSNFDLLKSKKKQSNLVKFWSYRNHLVTLIKNENWQNLAFDSVFILWYELKKFFYYLFFEREVLKGLTMIWKFRSELLKKRKDNLLNAKKSWKQIRIWWTK